MECNKDEALNAMELAERKMGSKDMKGAQKLAMRAQKLYPGLNGLEKMLAVIGVHLVSENKIHGEPDWYKILGVDPLAADVAIKQQYKKKVLLLHPDKNKFPGAPEAYGMFSEAWRVLSDENKKREYDKKLNIQSPNPREMSVPERGSASGPSGSGSGGPSKPTRKRKSQKLDPLARKAAADWRSLLNASTPPGSGAP